jgi:hypothetical protein
VLRIGLSRSGLNACAQHDQKRHGNGAPLPTLTERSPNPLKHGAFRALVPKATLRFLLLRLDSNQQPSG